MAAKTPTITTPDKVVEKQFAVQVKLRYELNQNRQCVKAINGYGLSSRMRPVW